MSYYHGLISSKKAEAILNCSLTDGCFLLRDSQSQPGHFVLSIRYDGKVYHVLIFHEYGQYYLDSSSSNDSSEKFNSLEELVLFGMSHELRVAGDEVMLLEPVICDTGKTAQLLKPYSNGMRSKRDGSEDYDILTDLFALVFGSHCSVLVAVHSHLNFDGTPLPSPNSYLVCVVKDNQMKAFFVRTIDLSLKKLIAEKKITKTFEYDMPSELVLTFLSEHGITCVGFKNKQDLSMFTRHIDRIIQLQQEQTVQQLRVRDHPSMSPPKITKECSSQQQSIVHPLKAENFDIDNLSQEWEYLFEQAGVTFEMLKDKETLQFILDKISEMGGAPKNIDKVSESDERVAAIAVDSVLRHETVRAERLADKLRQASVDTPQPIPRKIQQPSCTYSSICTRYKDILLLRASLSALAPKRLNCYCITCAAGKPTVAVSGSPPQQYTLPFGWCQFILRSQTHSLAQKFIANWHVAFSCVSPSMVAEIIRTGCSIGARKDLVLSPDIKWLKRTVNVTPEHYYDEIEKADFRVNTAFQVFVQPGSYTVATSNDYNNPLQQIWETAERTHITYALLIHVQKC